MSVYKHICFYFCLFWAGAGNIFGKTWKKYNFRIYLLLLSLTELRALGLESWSDFVLREVFNLLTHLTYILDIYWIISVGLNNRNTQLSISFATLSRVLALFRPSTFIAISLVIFGTCLGGRKVSKWNKYIFHLFFSPSSPCLPSSTLSQVNPRWASLQQTVFQPLSLFLFFWSEENFHLDGACISWITPLSFLETSSSSCNALPLIREKKPIIR